MSNDLPPELKKLAEILGEDRIKSYIGYLENHDKLTAYEGFILPEKSGSVLLRRDIKDFCTKRSLPLIDPFEEDSLLGSASYHLRLGNKYREGDNDGYLSNDNRVLEIPKHGIAVVTTYEWLNIPGFLIARWNLKVKMVYRGLVWVGSLQVDPGYQGFLFCPLYNLSNETQRLTYMEPLFTIDFVVTNQYEDDSCKLWALPDKYSTFDFTRLDARRIKSAPQVEFKKQWDYIEDIKQEADKVSQENRRFQNVVWAALTIIITAIAVLATIGATDVTWDSDWIPALLSFFALVLSGTALWVAIRKGKK